MKNFYDYLEEQGFNYTQDKLDKRVSIEDENGEGYDFNDFAWHMLMNIINDRPKNLWIKSMNEKEIILVRQ
jgi:hypothetical protein